MPSNSAKDSAVGLGSEQLLKFGALLDRRIVRFEIRGVLDLCDDRRQRAALNMRLAEIPQARLCLVLHALFERRGQARFADAGLAGEQHDPAFAAGDLLPAAKQKLHLLLAPDQRRQHGVAQRLKAAGDAAFAQDFPGADRLGEAFERGRRDRFIGEQVAGQPPRCGVDHRSVRRRGRLQPSREVRCLADDVALLRFAGADQFADHDEAGGDADTDLMAALGKQPRDRLDQRQRGAYGILGVGLVGFRIAEIDQHTVAHIFGDIAAEPRDDLGCAFVIGRDHLAQVFRIEPGRKARSNRPDRRT